ncbi:MAG: PRTRC system protein C [Methylococcales bacterium]|nr:PRTRC system protein C [Methylobacter sp.]MDZ4154976.1 PRTRC system protein C [Methylococcales bacterium]MDP2097496.1 PRTRC system protein C [Methylobacter sp.]MDP2426687.1 PRTRC system protein C [Methylobacter sp.]MDP3055354.1 PRTRC system protein C [Methylobacter sp.]
MEHNKATVIRPVRIFKMGAVRLADPAPDLSPEEAIQLYAASYPHLAHVELNGPELIGEELHYAIKPYQEVKTKG